MQLYCNEKYQGSRGRRKQFAREERQGSEREARGKFDRRWKVIGLAKCILYIEKLCLLGLFN